MKKKKANETMQDLKDMFKYITLDDEKAFSTEYLYKLLYKDGFKYELKNLKHMPNRRLFLYYFGMATLLISIFSIFVGVFSRDSVVTVVSIFFANFGLTASNTALKNHRYSIEKEIELRENRKNKYPRRSRRLKSNRR